MKQHFQYLVPFAFLFWVYPAPSYSCDDSSAYQAGIGSDGSDKCDEPAHQLLINQEERSDA